MWFSTAAIAGLLLHLLANALPGPVSFGPGAEYSSGQLISRAGPTTGGSGSVSGAGASSSSKNAKINTTPKQVLFLQKKYRTMKYPAGPKQDKNPGADIMKEYRELHGPWIAIPGHSKLKKQAVGTNDIQVDHIAEIQLLNQFLEKLVTKWGDAKVEALFLANHDPTYFAKSASNIAGFTTRQTTPDYSRNDYPGSLLQHAMYQFGNVEYLDRLAVLSSDTNLRKGVLWKGGQTDIKHGVEVLLDLIRTDEYMVEERDGFCATVNGIHQVFRDFRTGRKKATPIPSGASGGQTALALRPNPKGTGQNTNTGQTANTGQISGAGAVLPSTPQRPAADPRPQRQKNPVVKEGFLTGDDVTDRIGEETPSKEKETPLNKQKNDPQHGKAIGENEPPLGSGDVLVPALSPPFSAPQDLDLDDFWVKHVKKSIYDFGARLGKDVKAFAKSTDREVLARKADIDGFKSKSMAKLLECSSLKTRDTPIDKSIGKGAKRPSTQKRTNRLAAKADK